MRGLTKEQLESATIPDDPYILDKIEHCLRALYEDKKHNIEEEIVRGLSFEEVIGTLIQARDEINNLQAIISE